MNFLGKPQTFQGMDVTVSIHATEEVLRFPRKKRSKRLHKKLTKIWGEQVYHKPCTFRTPQGIVVHPEIYAALRNEYRMNAAA